MLFSPCAHLTSFAPNLKCTPQTRRRRQAAGRYARPTAAQAVAFKRLMARDGYANLTQEECAALATHPALTVSQRDDMAARAAASPATPDAYSMGRLDYTVGLYVPPSCDAADYGDYLRGWNDEWAAAKGVKLAR
jgi:hypothetical protein